MEQEKGIETGKKNQILLDGKNLEYMTRFYMRSILGDKRRVSNFFFPPIETRNILINLIGFIIVLV